MDQEPPTQMTTQPQGRSLLRIILATAVCLIVLGAIILTVVLLKKTEPPASVKNKAATVTITAQGFQPTELLVEKGTKVVWTNEDTKGHKIGANPFPTHDSLKDLVSPILAQNESYSYTFGASGTYYYHDGLSPSTGGSVVVQ